MKWKDIKQGYKILLFLLRVKDPRTLLIFSICVYRIHFESQITDRLSFVNFLQLKERTETQWKNRRRLRVPNYLFPKVYVLTFRFTSNKRVNETFMRGSTESKVISGLTQLHLGSLMSSLTSLPRTITRVFYQPNPFTSDNTKMSTSQSDWTTLRELDRPSAVEVYLVKSICPWRKSKVVVGPVRTTTSKWRGGSHTPVRQRKSRTVYTKRTKN